MDNPNTMIFVSILILVLFLYLVQEPFAIYKESPLNDNTYKVQEYKNPQNAADMLAKLRKKTQEIVNYLKVKYSDDDRIARLVNRTKNLNIEESVHEENTSSFTINKGELISFCLRKKDTNKNFHDMSTMMFVLIHELAHVMSESEGHNDEFMKNFKFLLKEAEEGGLYIPIDYSNNPIVYCGVKVTNNPFFN